MSWKGLSRGFAVVIFGSGMASGQSLPTAARIESVPLELTMPERYQIAEQLEPIRRVTLIAPADGFIRGMESRLGAALRESQEIAQLDRAEAAARLKIAAAEVKEKQGLLKGSTLPEEVVRAQIDSALGRAELAQLALDRCTLRAPFSGRLTAQPVCAGQYVVKGTTIAELADISSLKTLVPVDRRSASVGAALTVQVEGQELTGKVLAILPLPDQYIALRELATPFAAAWVVIPNAKGELEPGLRVRPTTIPNSPIATVPKRALKQDRGSSDSAVVQVIRNDSVTNVPVRVLGDTGPERTQITGTFRRLDALIVASSPPLLAGTLVRFGEGATANHGAEGMAPSSPTGGVDAGVSQPGGAVGRGTAAGTARTPRGPANSQSKPAAPAASPTPY